MLPGFSSFNVTYEGCLESSWTHLITSSRNFVEVRWRSLSRSTSLGKWCTSYNASPTSRKRAADRSPQPLGGWSNRRCARSTATRFIFTLVSPSRVYTSWNRISFHCIVSIGLTDELLGFCSTFSKPNTEFNSAALLLRHPKKGSYKTTVPQTLMTVRGINITPLLCCPHYYNLA
jgi:hypothetical protein